MSMVTRQLAPVLDRLNSRSLPNATPVIVIGSLSIRGHTFGNSTISTTGSSGAQFGDYIAMSQTKSTRPGYQPETPPPSDIGKAIDDGTSSAPDEPASEYRDRDHDWFTPGRLFRIFAREDTEIHEKEFVLLDSKNKEGPGLLIRTYEEDDRATSRGYFLRSHVSVQNYIEPDNRVGDSKLKVVYLDEYEDQDVMPGTWIELEHTYNIPFAKYKCVDCGVLDRASLQDLRRCYLDWLRYHWSID